MIEIKASNVNEALSHGIRLMLDEGEVVPSRVGKTLEVPEPVATVYTNPTNRVLMDEERDANPFFHLMEAMWILKGRQDVQFLTEFNKRMDDYSDDGEVFNAPYGHRLRNGIADDRDQIQGIVSTLLKDPYTRQAVGLIWDDNDLGKDTLDKACNMMVVFRVRNDKLDMTVYNRSNDMLWGAYGANVVQFSILHEYVSACTSIPMGTYTQVSNSFHVYLDGPGGVLWNKMIKTPIDLNPYSHVENKIYMPVGDMLWFNRDLSTFFNIYDKEGLKAVAVFNGYHTEYFNRLVLPVLRTYLLHKEITTERALEQINYIKADDWRWACEKWLQRRVK